MPCGFGNENSALPLLGALTLSLLLHLLSTNCAPDTMSTAHTLLSSQKPSLLVAFIEGGKLQLKEVKELPPRHTTSVRFKPGPSESDPHVLSTLLHLGLP